MTNKEILDHLLVYANPELRKKPGHVAEIWQDGEYTLTKSGDLYGLRGLHCIMPGHHRFKDEPMVFPGVRPNSSGNSCIAVPYDVAEWFQKEVWGF